MEVCTWLGPRVPDGAPVTRCPRCAPRARLLRYYSSPMARFHPSRFPDELKADRAGAAEYAVFEALADDLPDDWLVIHRVRWIDGPAQGWRSDGECDFLIAHPDRGLLV